MSLQVKNCIIGEGTPKICVPVMGVTKEEILEQASRVAKAGPDLVEWRADYYKDILEPGKAEEVLDKMADLLGEMPILFTFRTAAEGGQREISVAEYGQLMLAVAKQQIAALIDIEVYKQDLDAEALIIAIHEAGGVVVASNHDFDKTPSRESMTETLQTMERMSADILKLAVMPKRPEDVLNLLWVTRYVSANTEKPIITMSMGKLGVISRISGQTFGSAVTFACVGEASAPGQISLEDMRNILHTIA